MGIRRVVPDIQTDRMDGSRAFYTDILGFRLGMDEGWVTGVVSPDNETAQIQFMTADATAPVTPHITVEVDDVDDVYGRAVEAGHEIVHPMTDEPWGVRRFFVRDPNGVIVNVMSHLPRG